MNYLTSNKLRIQSSSLTLPRIWSMQLRVKLTYDWPRSRPDPETFCLYCHQLFGSRQWKFYTNQEKEKQRPEKQAKKRSSE